MDSTHTMNQTRGVPCWRAFVQPSFDEHLLERILSPDNLRDAFERVESNKGAPGVDGMKVEDFREWAKEHWPGIVQSIRDGSYVPSPVRRKEIPKDRCKNPKYRKGPKRQSRNAPRRKDVCRNKGKMRRLGIPTVLDRTIQQAISQVLTPMFDPTFSQFSYGFRPCRSAHQAVKQIQSYIREGYNIAVDVDLEKFFDLVNHDLLMERLSRRIKDKRVLKLIGLYLKAGVMVGRVFEDVSTGVPQGGPLSPLLANIMLDDFDKELESRGHKFARYADDFIILVKSKRAGERVMTSITRFLNKKLKLSVNTEKSQVVTTNECSFLGFTFKGEQIRWTEKSYQKFRWRIRQLTSRTWGTSMKERLKKLQQYINGWMGYYRLSEYYAPIAEIDKWIRRRIRMCFLKMWKRPRTTMRKLIKLGVSIPNAVGLGRSRKKWIRRSNNPTINKALNNNYLTAIGLVSVRDRWIKFHYPE